MDTIVETGICFAVFAAIFILIVLNDFWNKPTPKI